MRLAFGRTRARILLCLGAFFLSLLSSLLLYALPSPVQAQATTSSPPIEITTGWKCRWGDSPVNKAGVPVWTQTDTLESAWKPVNVGAKVKKLNKHRKIAWLRVRLPDGQWKSPTLYPKFTTYIILDIYLENQRVAQLASLDSSGNLKEEENKFKFLPLNSDFAGKTLFLRVYVGDQDFLFIKPQGVRLGSQADLVNIFLQEFSRNIVNLTLGAFYILTGAIALLFGWKSLYKSTYLSFGLLAISTGLSTLATSGDLSLLIDQPQWNSLPEIGRNAGILALLLMPGLICFFFEQVFDKGYKNIIKRMGQIYLSFTIITYILFVTLNLINFNLDYTVLVSWKVIKISYFIILSITLLSLLINTVLFLSKNKTDDRILASGLICLIICFLLDFFCLMGVFKNNIFFKENIFNLGMLIFLCLLGWILQRRLTEASKRLKCYAQELESKNAALQQMDKLKDEFLANTSHELRTPLNGIIGIAESLMDGATGKLHKPTLFNLSLIVSSGRRLTQLVNDLLDFSKLRDKTISLRIQPVGMREITDVVLTLSQPLIGKKPLQLVNSISPDIPLVDADENRVQQILHNLIYNAIKFSQAGVVEVSAAVVDNYLEITISDNGIGIPADKLDRIFKEFEQADGSIAREYGGAGLGLAVSKQLVQLHGGEIRVVSEPGKGSCFTFTLPVSQAKLPTMSPHSSPQVSNLLEINNDKFIDVGIPATNDEPFVNPEMLMPSNGNFQILIVDDEPVNLQVLVNHLSLCNYGITQASNGMEALAIIEQGFKPDLIVLDVMMPRMTGYEVCQKIREQFPATELPVVLMTAKNQVSDLVEGFNSGANDYLTKPISKNELLARIRTHLQLSKINIAYGRFVPREFLEFLQRESIVDVQLGDQVQQEMTILFSDIRSFTTLSENMTPKENFDFLNDYLKRVGPVIRKHKGFIDKYIGDAVMALFPKVPDEALKAAIEMQHQVSLYNLDREAEGYPSIAIGVGLHTGSLMLGTIGEEQRMESTVIADAVNLASRMEGLTKVYGAGILISEQTLSELKEPEKYSHRFLGRVTVKGKKIAVAVFEVYEGDADSLKALKTQTRAEFERGVELFEQQKFSQALLVFESVLEKNEQDKPARLYVERCQTAQMDRKDGLWEAVETVQERR